MGGRRPHDFSRRLALYRDIREDSLWLVDLVENLLAVTRAEEGRLDLNIQPRLSPDVMEEAVRHCERHADAHAIRIDSEGELLLASMDARFDRAGSGQFDKQCGELHACRKARLFVSAHKHGSWIRIDVADNGLGIVDEEKSYVFDMFYNGSHERGDHRRGMGLGLALCKSIVEAHGGRIGVRRVPAWLHILVHAAGA